MTYRTGCPASWELIIFKKLIGYGVVSVTNKKYRKCEDRERGFAQSQPQATAQQAL